MHYDLLSMYLRHPRSTRTPSIAFLSPLLPFLDNFPCPQPIFLTPYMCFISTLFSGHLAVVPLSLYLLKCLTLLSYSIYIFHIFTPYISKTSNALKFCLKCLKMPFLPLNPCFKGLKAIKDFKSFKSRIFEHLISILKM